MLPTTAELLTAWERGAAAPPGRRALELTALARDDLTDDERGALTAGERDAALLDLREVLFGPTLDGVLGCPACDEPLELALPVAEVRAGAGPTADDRTVVHDGYEVRFRPPTALDLAEVADEPDDALAALLDRCVLAATADGRAVAPHALPDGALAALDEALAAADPQADLELAVACPGCGERTSVRFDVAAFLWSELERFALTTLREVHVLASAYGWSEAEILGLGVRRRLYLELIEG